MTLSETLVIFAVSQVFILLSVTWKAASVYGELKTEIKKNREDINNLGRQLRQFDRLAWQRLDNIDNFLQQNYNYNPSSLNLFEQEEK